MSTCQNCNNKWSWKQTFKKSSISFGGMTCPYCGKKQYQTKRSGKRITIIYFTIFLLIMLNNIFFCPSYITFFTLLGLIPLFFIINSFFVELSNEKELPFLGFFIYWMHLKNV